MLRGYIEDVQRINNLFDRLEECIDILELESKLRNGKNKEIGILLVNLLGYILGNKPTNPLYQLFK